MDMSAWSNSDRHSWIKRYLLVICLLVLSCSTAWLVSANIFSDTKTTNTNTSTTAVALQLPGDAVVSRHSITLSNGSRVEGSVRQLTGENTTISSGTITGDFLVPGSPTVQVTSTQPYNGTIEDTGSSLPAN